MFIILVVGRNANPKLFFVRWKFVCIDQARREVKPIGNIFDSFVFEELNIIFN